MGDINVRHVRFFQKWMVIIGDVRQLAESSKVILYGAALVNILRELAF